VVSEVSRNSGFEYSPVYSNNGVQMNFSMQGTERNCVELTTELLHSAEKELAAFARAVEELFGSEQARQSIEDWVNGLELMDLPVGGAMPDMRRVTIAAASQLAIRAQPSRFRNAAEFTTLLCRAHKETMYVGEFVEEQMVCAGVGIGNAFSFLIGTAERRSRQ